MLKRRHLVADLLKARGDALVVTGLGSPTYDVAAAGDDDRNFYLWGAMGSAAMLGLGLALAQPKQRVLVVTGDGEMLMGLGSLAAIAAQRPANLAILVLDNEAFGETGAQAGLTGKGVDLSAVAAAAGFAEALRATGPADVEMLARLLFQAKGPVFAAAKVALDGEPMVLPPRDGRHLVQRFRAALLGRERAVG
ncbi:MAG TPA: thiamine pyrophosphate-dependent enzyme [Alphaproteobacteria bacterium]|nr:thiamine pyrophosphate-dependent enzyme [Alphaproteobacteria bacterium]